MVQRLTLRKKRKSKNVRGKRRRMTYRKSGRYSIGGFPEDVVRTVKLNELAKLSLEVTAAREAGNDEAMKAALARQNSIRKELGM